MKNRNSGDKMAAPKKKLLKPPSENGKILFLPELSEIQKSIMQNKSICTCHQLSFVHPGISVRFHFLDTIKWGKKNLIFMDTDRTRLHVKVPRDRGTTLTLDLIDSEKAVCKMKPILKNRCDLFFKKVENEIDKGMKQSRTEVLRNVNRYRNILTGINHPSGLRGQLAESFIAYNNIKSDYTYLSDLIMEKSFLEFFLEIYHDDNRFRSIYNESIELFRQEYRFRYKSYPFPKLKNDELPFWTVYDGERVQLKKSDVTPSDIGKYLIFPKASPLTLFLRLYKSDILLHGVGGANYEWINDRIIENFFRLKAPSYFVLSATFLINNIPEREYPYFFIDPESVRKTLIDYMHEHAFKL
jgi:hypothetical protein